MRNVINHYCLASNKPHEKVLIVKVSEIQSEEIDLV